MRYKGISHSLEILIGLIVCVFILMIALKLLGVYSDYQYEQQAQITAKNLQTAMNRVCVSGQPMEVNVNFPQELTSGGKATNPISLILDKFTGRKDAVTNALRYMTALQSYGDPWYVIYYEDFPQEEDAGWTGWSEVAAMRTTSMVMRGITVASCAMNLIPFSGVGKRISRFVTKLSEREGKIAKLAKAAIKISRKARATGRAVSKVKNVGKLLNAQKTKLAKKMFFKEIGKKIRGKVNVGKAWLWIKGKSIKPLTRHLTESSKLIEVYRGFFKVGNKLKSVSDSANNVVKKLREVADKGLYKEVSNEEIRKDAINLKALSNPKLRTRKGALRALGVSDVNNFYKKIGRKGKRFMNELDSDEIKAMLPEDEHRVLKDLARKLEKKRVPNKKDIENARGIMARLEAKGSCRGGGCKKINSYLDVTEDYTNLHRMGETLNKENLIDDAFSFRYTRSILLAEASEPFASGLPGLAAYIARAAKRGMVFRGGPIATKWGIWHGSSFVFSKALSLADVSMLKFSPCSDHALCLKSQVNPSITIYPLDECKEAGIDYIQLDKYPPGEEGVLGFTRWIDSVTGSSPVSKFYTASPCEGKLKIEKKECECSGVQKPYFDYSSQDVFIFDCVLTSTTEAECNFTKYMDYLNETEDLGLVTKSSSSSSEINVSEITNSTGHFIKYNVSVDFNDEIWDQGYKDFKSTEDPRPFKCTKYVTDTDHPFSCEFSMPSIPFHTTKCEGSNLWLECTNWTEGDTETKELPGMEEKTEVEITEWFCVQWNLTDYGAEENTAKIINVSEEYEWGWGGLDGPSDTEIKNNLNSTLNEGTPPGSAWNISDPDAYYNSVIGNVIKAIKNTSEIELNKGEDPNNASINALYMHNLYPKDKTPCLRVTYIKDDTKGFCYSSPPNGEFLEEIGTMAGSIVTQATLEAGGAALCGLSSIPTGGTTAVACEKAASFAACEIGNMVMWYGQNQVAEHREARLWPHNTFFGKYYTK